MPNRSPIWFNSSASVSFSSLGIQTMRRCPPSAAMNLRLATYALPTPMKPGTCWPPPVMFANVENFMPAGVSPVYSRLTIMTPLASGSNATMASKQPQLVIGCSSSE